MKTSIFRLILISFILFLSQISVAQDEPVLVIDPQGHASMVRDLIFTPDGGTLISVSDDKTIRFWNTKTGLLKKTLRGHIGEGSEGKLYSADISPDGKFLAVGGWLTNNDSEYGRIRIINLETGKLVYNLTGHTDVVFGLAFSPDGRYLASGSADKSVRIYEITPTNGRMLAVLNGHTDGVQQVRFVNPKRVVSVGYDNLGILWDWENNSIAQRLERHTDKLSGLATSPDGKYIATAGYDRKILLWDNKGTFIKQIDEANDGMYTLAFSPDGKRIIAHGSRDAHGRVYTIPGGQKITTFEMHDNTVVSSAFHGNMVATSGGENNDIYIWDANSGKVLHHIVGKGLVKRSVGFNRSNSNQVGFGSLWGGDNGKGELEYVFDFEQVQLIQEKPVQSNFVKTTLSQGDKMLNLSGELSLEVDGGGGTIFSDDASEGNIWSYSFTPKGDVLVGTSFTFQMYNSAGKIIKKLIGHTAETWAVSASPDGRKYGSANGDQTIKIWSAESSGEFPSINDIYTHPTWGDIWRANKWESVAEQKNRQGWLKMIENLKSINYEDDAKTLRAKLNELSERIKPLLTIFIGTDEEWVCWTPEGYYAASAGGEKYIGWHISKGINNLGEYYPVSAFRKKYYQPELVKLVYQLGDFDKALAKFNETQTVKVKEENILSNLPPKIEWLNPIQSVTKVSGNKFKVRARITSDTEIKSYKLMINGRTVGKQRGLEVVEAETATEKFINIELSLDTHESNLLVYASNANSATLSDERTLVMESSTRSGTETIDLPIDVGGQVIKPNLYGVFVGVSNFQKNAYNLEYADDDAKTLSEIFKLQGTKFYNKIEVKQLLNEQATRTNILDAFDWLEKNATHKDMVVIFIASHGFNERDKFYILPHEGDHEKLRVTAVDWLDFKDVLGNLPSKVLLFLDACHSGKLSANLTRGLDDVNTEAIREISSDEHGVVVMTASTGNEKSLEGPEWKHGAFTYSIIEALQQGKADVDKNGVVYLNELDFYVAERVKELTKGKQHPTTQKPGTISRLPIIKVN